MNISRLGSIFGGRVAPRGKVKMKVIRHNVQAPLAWRVRNAIRPGYWLGWLFVMLAKLLTAVTGIPTLTSQVSLVKIDGKTGQRIDYGVVGFKVVTNAGVNAIVDAFQNTFELELFRYHGIGTGSTAENASDTALVTELTTEYNPDSTRATGTIAEGASANIFQTVATNTIDSGTPAIQEHGVFSQAATGGGTLLDRTVFATINLAANDSLQSTYELTLNAGS